MSACGDVSLGTWIQDGLPGAPSPWDDPVWRPLAGFSGRLANNVFCAQRAAPRRAEGPDLSGFFVGAQGRLGQLERVTLAVLRRGVSVDPTPGGRPSEAPPSAEELGAFEDVERVLRRG